VNRLLSIDERQRLINRAGYITLAINVTLTVARGLAGYLSGSTAVLADAANSGTDILATTAVLIGARIAASPPDADHPYGHEKAEPVAAKIVGLIVTFAGAVTALGVLSALRGGGAEQVGALAALVTSASIGIKEVLARYLTGVGRRTGNEALLADATNQRTDVLASAAALVGALGARFGVPALDPAMGLLVAGLILRMGLSLYWRSVSNLMDPAPDSDVMDALKLAAARVAGVINVDEIKARIAGAGIYVDCKVCVDAALTVQEGHEIASHVKRALLTAADEVRDVLVHINPCRPDGSAVPAVPPEAWQFKQEGLGVQPQQPWGDRT
jgi:cation diffusion facilitator family transporter